MCAALSYGTYVLPWNKRARRNSLQHIHTSALLNSFFFLLLADNIMINREPILSWEAQIHVKNNIFFHYSISSQFSWVLNPAYHHFLFPLPVTVKPYFSLALHLMRVPRGCAGTWTLSEGNQLQPSGSTVAGVCLERHKLQSGSALILIKHS